MSDLGEHIKYMLAKVQSRASLAKTLSISSEMAFPNLTFYTQKLKKSCLFKGC